MKSSHQDPVKVLTSKRMKKKHVFYAKEGQRLFHQISLLVLTLASMMVSLVLVPFLIFFEPTFAYILVVVVSLVFGFIYSYMVVDLQYLERKHHLITAITIPFTAVVDLFIMIMLTKKVAEYFSLSINFDPFVVSMFYLLGFILPYLFFALAHHFKHRS